MGTSAPAAVARRGTTLLDLAVRSTNNAIYHRAFQPGAGWSPWASLGGNLSSGPALNSQDPGVLNVWARGTDAQLYQRAWTGSAWRGWEARGGGLVGAPSTISRRQNVVDIFARGANGALYQKSWTGTTSWIEWALRDARPLDSTPAAASDTADHVVLFARSGATMLIKEWRGGSGWTRGATGVRSLHRLPPLHRRRPRRRPPPANGLANLQTGVRCTPPGGRLKVRLRIRKRRGAAKPRVRRVVFFVLPERAQDRPQRAVRRPPAPQPARGSTGRVYARAYYTRKGSRKVRKRTVSRRFVMCG